MSDGAGITRTLNRVVNVDVMVAWRALTQPVELAKWLADVEFDPRAGGAVHFVWPSQGETRGSVQVVDGPSILQCTWDESDGGWSVNASPPTLRHASEGRDQYRGGLAKLPRRTRRHSRGRVLGVQTAVDEANERFGPNLEVVRVGRFGRFERDGFLAQCQCELALGLRRSDLNHLFYGRSAWRYSEPVDRGCR